MVVIDTDVFLLAFAFQKDPRQLSNTRFLQAVQTADPALTIYNLMELLGHGLPAALSFNLSPAQLDAYPSWLIAAYQLTLIWPEDNAGLPAAAFFRAEFFERPLARMRAKRMGLMDALVLNLAERTPEVNLLVTRNARHFKNKSSLTVLTPEEYLA